MKSAIAVACFIAFVQVTSVQAADEFFTVRIIDESGKHDPAKTGWIYTLDIGKQVNIVYEWQDDGSCEVADWWVTTPDLVTTECRIIGTGKLTLRLRGVGIGTTDLAVQVANQQVRLRLVVVAKAD